MQLIKFNPFFYPCPVLKDAARGDLSTAVGVNQTHGLRHLCQGTWVSDMPTVASDVEAFQRYHVMERHMC